MKARGERLRVAHERGQRKIFEQCTGYLTKVLEGSHNVIITTSTYRGLRRQSHPDTRKHRRVDINYTFRYGFRLVNMLHLARKTSLTRLSPLQERQNHSCLQQVGQNRPGDIFLVSRTFRQFTHSSASLFGTTAATVTPEGDDSPSSEGPAPSLIPKGSNVTSRSSGSVSRTVPCLSRHGSQMRPTNRWELRSSSCAITWDHQTAVYSSFIIVSAIFGDVRKRSTNVQYTIEERLEKYAT